jgi:hypothetical protein
MAEKPPGMHRKDGNRDRGIGSTFPHDEFLYRRVPDCFWDDAANPPFELDAVRMPDMSVARSKYAHPEWLRLESVDHSLWGVIGFEVGKVPPEMFSNGVRFVFRVEHDPLPHNYPHTVVRAFRDGDSGLRHVDSEKDLPADRYLLWREKLRRVSLVLLGQGERCEIRQRSPQSHHPEYRQAE